MADANPTPSCIENETSPTSAATATIIPFPQGSREYAQHGVALTAALALIRYGSDCVRGEYASLQWLIEHCGTLVGGVPDEVVAGLPAWAAAVRGSFERGRGLPGVLQRVSAPPEAEQRQRSPSSLRPSAPAPSTPRRSRSWPFSARSKQSIVGALAASFSRKSWRRRSPIFAPIPRRGRLRWVVVTGAQHRRSCRGRGREVMNTTKHRRKFLKAAVAVPVAGTAMGLDAASASVAAFDLSRVEAWTAENKRLQALIEEADMAGDKGDRRSIRGYGV